jgi:DNA-dependent RNA polymerase auxiliary subunit epsilon
MPENSDTREQTQEKNIEVRRKDIEELHSNKYDLEYLEYIDDEDV